MMTLARCALGLALLAHVSVASPIIFSRDGLQQPLKHGSPGRKLTGKFLHISDFHPDLNYKPYTDDDTSCHRGSGSAGYWGAETTDCDSPATLVNATFDWLAANVRGDIDFVVWTGDSARHDGDEDLPRHADEITTTNRWIADKFAETFSSGKQGQLAIPVVPSMGNNDFLPHNIFYAGPNKWLSQYLDIWRHFIPGEQHHSFKYGGWFSIEVVPQQLSVLSLNTMYFFSRNAGVDGCADPSEPGYQHLEWLRIHLQDLRERGMKAILTGHVPPARTENKQLWDESCWQKYTLWMRQYRDVVTASLYGHMNIDHFIVADSKEIGDDLGARQREAEGGWFDDDDDLDYSEGASYSGSSVEDGAIDGGELSVQGKGNYLADLRSDWSKLPKPLKPKDVQSEAASGRRDNKWGERYSLAIVNPSIVPNYLPTIRIYEYNITGLEDNPVWRDDPNKSANYELMEDGEENEGEDEGEDEDEDEGEDEDEDEGEDEDEENVVDLAATDEDEPAHQDLKRDLDSFGRKKKKDKKGKNKKGKKKRPHRPHDPKLIIPSPPSKTAEPGPAYSPQPLTLTGYTQWFANLTRLNNMPPEGFATEARHPKHLPFEFEVEYNTFTDKWYRIPDLTVKSYVKLAYRIARRSVQPGSSSDGGNTASTDGVDLDEDDEFESDFGDNEDDIIINDNDDDVEMDGGKKKHKKRLSNKLWLRFLGRAFIGTMPKEDLKKWDD